MRATELLASEVYDGAGARLGSVRDVRLTRERDGTFRVIGLVVGEGPLAGLAHAWGFAEGRASGPWLFRKALRRASRDARYIRADDVEDWAPAGSRSRRAATSCDTCARRRTSDPGRGGGRRLGARRRGDHRRRSARPAQAPVGAAELQRVAGDNTRVTRG